MAIFLWFSYGFLWFHIVTGESMVSTPFNPLRQAASQAQASQAMAPGELQLSYESDCVVVRAGAWCFFSHSYGPTNSYNML